LWQGGAGPPAGDCAGWFAFATDAMHLDSRCWRFDRLPSVSSVHIVGFY